MRLLTDLQDFAEGLRTEWKNFGTTGLLASKYTGNCHSYARIYGRICPDGTDKEVNTRRRRVLQDNEDPGNQTPEHLPKRPTGAHPHPIITIS